MIIDAQNQPSSAQSVAVGVSTIVSTNSIDMLSTKRLISRGHPVRMHAALATALVGVGGSIQCQLIESASGALTSPTVLASGPVLAAPQAAGKELLDVPIPDTSKRYLGVQYVITGATITAGTVNAQLVAGTDRPTTDIPFNTGL